MKLFLDTGDVDAVKRANDTGLLDGVTTNPTHVSQRPGVDSSRWCRRSVPLWTVR
jgi:transaldolase